MKLKIWFAIQITVKNINKTSKVILIKCKIIQADFSDIWSMLLLKYNLNIVVAMQRIGVYKIIFLI